METFNKITCPNCGHIFNAEQALAHEVEEKLRGEYNRKFKSIQAELLKKSDDREEEQRRKFVEERTKMEIELREKAIKDVEVQLKNSSEELETKRKELQEAKGRELELIKKERQLEEQRQELELQVQRTLMEERKNIEEHAKRKSDEENQLRIKEKDMLVDQLMKQVDEMKKRAEQGSMQVQGEAMELMLEELLKGMFPFDTISEVGKGVKGADVVQSVKNNTGKECGTIIYESKRTKAFNVEWIHKLKQDLRNQKSDLAIIVTETMPRDMDRFGQKEGIWICTFAEVKGVAAVLRESLIRIYDIKSSQENKGDKMQLIYDYLAGNEFRQYIESFMETFKAMNDNLLKEKAQTKRYWNEREKQTEKMLLTMSGMYGSIKGIMGSAVPEVQYLNADENFIE